MACDVILEDEYGVKITGPDLRLDFKDRRKNSSQFRRALVHDDGDTLSLNFGNDYPGGVKINGPVLVQSEAIQYTGNVLDFYKPGSRAGRFSIGNWFGTYTFFANVENFSIRNPDINLQTPHSPLISLSNDTATNSLIINKGKGYDGGVKIEGDLHLDGDIETSNTCKIAGITFEKPKPVVGGQEHIVHPKQSLILNPGTILIKTDSISVMGQQPASVMDLVEEIRSLRNELDQLKLACKNKGITP